MGYYPLYMAVQLAFGAMFAFADSAYNGPLATAAHFVMSATLTQAWFPAHAEIWNAPTWFLSALSFAMLVLPHALPGIAAMRKAGLQRLLACLTACSLLGKLAYSYDLGAWTLLEGFLAPRLHPNLLLWNVTRFHPFYAALEVLIGVAAVRLVMTERVDDEGKPLATPAPAPGSALLPLAGLLAVTAARAAGWVTLNDPLTRGLLFIPLFTLLVMRLHRHTAAAAPGAQPAGLAGVLAHPVLTYLGQISFPIFIVHGALGQVFYKKIIATKLWGAVMPQSFFPAYCAIVLLAAAALNHLFVVRAQRCVCYCLALLTHARARAHRRTRRCRRRPPR
jgi:peptidoglycan/LPS O-acetylase OafA/YrhL